MKKILEQETVCPVFAAIDNVPPANGSGQGGSSGSGTGGNGGSGGSSQDGN